MRPAPPRRRGPRLCRAAGAAIGVLACLIPSAWGAFERPAWRQPDRDWAEGPIWYVMATAEYDAYRALRTEEERRTFIRDFWDGRDPIPDTPDNEVEREFWRRVNLADEHFGQGVKPGWKTQRGKLFILLGPPLNTEEDRILEDRWSTTRWTYDLGALPVVLRRILQDTLQVPADREIVDIKVLDDPEGMRAVAGSVVTESSVLRPTGALKIADELAARIPGPGAMKYLGLLMRVPEALESASLRVSVSTLFRLVPVEARVDFRPSTGGATAVAVTIGVPARRPDPKQDRPEEAGDVIVSGYLSTADGTRTYPLTGSFRADPRPEHPPGEEGPRVFQAVTRVPAGRYLIHAAYRDTRTRVMGSVRDYIEVPPYAHRGLTASSLVLSNRLDLLEDPAPRDAEPFRMGRYRVIPRTTPVYPRAADLTVFYEVYGAEPGPDGQVHLDLEYQFFIDQGGTPLTLGPPFRRSDARESGQAWRVPLRGWPAGDYRLEITITDRTTGARVVRATAFRIVASSSGSARLTTSPAGAEAGS